MDGDRTALLDATDTARPRTRLHDPPVGWVRLGHRRTFAPGTVTSLPMQDRLGRREPRSGACVTDLVVWTPEQGSSGVAELVLATESTCPHLGAHLGAGTVRDSTLVCPFHEFAFGPDGRSVPSTDGRRGPACSLPSVPTASLGEEWYAFLGRGEEAPWPLEPLGEPPVDRPHIAVVSTSDLPAPSVMVLEGDADTAHFSPVHGLDVVDHRAVYDGHRAEFDYLLGPDRARVHVVVDGLTRMYQTVNLGPVELHYSASFFPVAPGACVVSGKFWAFAKDRDTAKTWLRTASEGFAAAVEQDAAIWSLRSDGPMDDPADPDIAEFRRWASSLLVGARS